MTLAVRPILRYDPYPSTTARAAVSHEPSSPLVDQKSLRDSLARVSAGHQEFQSFFSKVFDELDTLWTDSAQRQERWDAQRQASEADLRERTERLEQERAELNTQWERAREQAEANRAELAELAEARREIHARRETIEQDASEAGPDPEFQGRFDQVVGERQELAEERAALETELELVRNQTAELAETIAAERKQSAEERSEGSAELKRMRRLLELIADRSTAAPASPQAAARPSGDAAGEPPADPVLDSVMAQFEVLQKDLARRRNVKAKTKQ